MEEAIREDTPRLPAGAIPEPFEKVRSLKETENIKMVASPVLYQSKPVSEPESPPIPSKSPVPSIPPVPVKPVQMDLFEEKMLTSESRSEYQIMGQIFDTYWLVAFKDKLFIIDQHAAHEKVKYERFMKQLAMKTIQSQIINPPVIVTLSGREEAVLRESADIFREMGFEIEEFGGNEYAIRSVPTDLYGCSEGDFFTEILDELAEGQLKGTPQVVRQRIATMACKAAVKGNMSFDRAGMESLIDQLLALEDPYHCPHGRPTIISMSKYEIEKKFKRIV